MNLHSFGHRHGVAAAPHRDTAAAGRQIFAEGGNALEATIAMAASIAAVYPHMNHIGGDGFWLVRERSGRVRAFMGAGPAGAGASIARYAEHGLAEIPVRGPLAALTVPGAVGTWSLALEYAAACGGRLPLKVLLQSAIEQARGYTVTRSQAELCAESLATLEAAPGFADTFLIDRKPPPAGARLSQPRFADTLDHLARAGLDDFYRGDVAREIAADLAAIASPIARADLEGYRAVLTEPLSLRLASGEVFNTAPPTQGLASLLILGLFDRLAVAAAESFDHVHGLVEATKRAFACRDRVITDPRRLASPPERYLEPAFLDAEARAIDRRRAAAFPAQPARGDTVWMGAADASGLVVSYIQSIYWEFGSGCVLPRTGVLMQNRGASFSLDRDAGNPLAPGRLPFHTLNPALAVLKDGRILAYGTMGGDGQPQTQAQLFTRHVCYGQPLEQALDRPRWLLGRTWGSPRTSLRVEARLAPHLIDQLMNAGHDVDVLAQPYADTMGHAGAVVLHTDGSLEGAHDPRADGGAAGL
ncbi:MAG TPA: gamma-glutamyltransferase [Xanthobacteraceae bacterium]|nr:gamma-glutamyltransferase [Xanthobacteraceae bacterium]